MPATFRLLELALEDIATSWRDDGEHEGDDIGLPLDEGIDAEQVDSAASLNVVGNLTDEVLVGVEGERTSAGETDDGCIVDFMLKAARIATEFLDEDAFTVKAQFSPMMKPSQAELDRAASAHKDALEQLVNSFATGKV